MNEGGLAASTVAAGIVPAITVLLLALCIKLKSSKKDPEFQGTIGTISHISTEVNHEPAVTAVTNETTPKPSPMLRTHIRTPSRTGDRKLPEIPRNGTEDSQSELYATVEEPPEENTVQMNSHHPYAKVRKTRVEHPYATVKKPAAASAPSADVTVDMAESSSTSSDDDDEDDGRRRFGGLKRPSTGSRGGSGRSGSHHNSRQATPLPLEPALGAMAAAGQSVSQQHFSGDSQDSRGYASISVRAPKDRISLPPTVALPRIDATYATVSETSDEMYAAIDDPTYMGANSQSNSDTYAVIDLPEETVQAHPRGGGEFVGGARPRIGAASSSEFHTYSTVDKGRKTATSQLPASKAAANGKAPAASSPTANNVEEMYAKVQKPSRSTEALSFEDPDFELPIGASAMHPTAEYKPMLNSKVKRSKVEVNYSDFDTFHYDKERARMSGVRVPAVKHEASEPGYESVPPPQGFGLADGYEQLPEYWRSTNSGGYETVRERESSREPGYEVVRSSRRLNNSDYDSLERKRSDASNYERLRGQASRDPPYAKIGAQWGDDNRSDSEVGYETIPVAADGSRRTRTNSDYDPNYEVLSRPVQDEEVTRPTLIHMSVQERTAANQRRSSLVVIERKNAEYLPQDAEDAEVHTHVFV